jgi:hypothetical protein
LDGDAVGVRVGDAIGAALGAKDGAAVGLADGAIVGAAVGETVGGGVGSTVGDALGAGVGNLDGGALGALGAAVGLAVGTGVGGALGEALGLAVGLAVGTAVGEDEGDAVGLRDGANDGGAVGVAVGFAVGMTLGAAVGFAVGIGPSVISTAAKLVSKVPRPNCTSWPPAFSAITVYVQVPTAPGLSMYKIMGLRRENASGPALMVVRPFTESPMLMPLRKTVRLNVVAVALMKIMSALKIRNTLSAVLTVVIVAVRPVVVHDVLVKESSAVVLEDEVSDAASTTAYIFLVLPDPLRMPYWVYEALRVIAKLYVKLPIDPGPSRMLTGVIRLYAFPYEESVPTIVPPRLNCNL